MYGYHTTYIVVELLEKSYNQKICLCAPSCGPDDIGQVGFIGERNLSELLSTLRPLGLELEHSCVLFSFYYSRTVTLSINKLLEHLSSSWLNQDFVLAPGMGFEPMRLKEPPACSSVLTLPYTYACSNGSRGRRICGPIFFHSATPFWALGAWQRMYPGIRLLIVLPTKNLSYILL